MERPTKSMVQLRMERGWSQRELARRAGVHLNTVWKTETHQSDPTLEVADKVSGALGVDPSEVAEFRPVVERVRGVWQEAHQQQPTATGNAGRGVDDILGDYLSGDARTLREAPPDYSRFQPSPQEQHAEDVAFAEREDITGLVEAEIGNATGADPMEEDVMANPELVRIGLRGALRALMRHLGRKETDQAYRRVFGSDPKDE